MAVREVFVSDLSGEEINGNAAKVTITLASQPNKIFTLDAKEDEVADFVSKSTVKGKKGRPAKVPARV